MIRHHWQKKRMRRTAVIQFRNFAMVARISATPNHQIPRPYHLRNGQTVTVEELREKIMARTMRLNPVVHHPNKGEKLPKICVAIAHDGAVASPLELQINPVASVARRDANAQDAHAGTDAGISLARSSQK